VFHVFGSIAHFERRLIGERTRDGLQAAAKGRKPGRPQLEEQKLSSALALVERLEMRHSRGGGLLLRN
jgi:DNA invertase Pin-like site-specific DNA recombinase